MQTIQITLPDSSLEQAVLRLAKQQQQNLADFVIAALNYYVQEKEKAVDLNVPKLNPLQHCQMPSMILQSPNESELIFSDIENSGVFAKQLRQQAWQRHG